MKTRTHFAYRVDVWDDVGDNIIEHVSGIEDFRGGEGSQLGSLPALAQGQDNAAAGRARVVHMSWRDWCHLSPVVLRPIR